MSSSFKIEFDYTNWKGEESHRNVSVHEISFTSNEFHPIPQWIMTGFDIDKKQHRNFAMKDMKNVTGIMGTELGEFELCRIMN